MTARTKVAEPEPDDKLWRPEDAAEFLSISKYSLMELARAGRIPNHKIGGQRRFIPSEVRRWARSRAH